MNEKSMNIIEEVYRTIFLPFSAYIELLCHRVDMCLPKLKTT